MARYTGPNNKQARRVSFSILENGKDLKRPFGPGQHGKDRKKKPSNYAIKLNSKQKFKQSMSNRTPEQKAETSKKLSILSAGKLFYNNGIECHRYYENEQPAGYVRGKLLKKVKK